MYVRAYGFTEIAKYGPYWVKYETSLQVARTPVTDRRYNFK